MVGNNLKDTQLQQVKKPIWFNSSSLTFYSQVGDIQLIWFYSAF